MKAFFYFSEIWGHQRVSLFMAQRQNLSLLLCWLLQILLWV